MIFCILAHNFYVGATKVLWSDTFLGWHVIYYVKKYHLFIILKAFSNASRTWPAGKKTPLTLRATKGITLTRIIKYIKCIWYVITLRVWNGKWMEYRSCTFQWIILTQIQTCEKFWKFKIDFKTGTTSQRAIWFQLLLTFKTLWSSSHFLVGTHWLENTWRCVHHTIVVVVVRPMCTTKHSNGSYFIGHTFTSATTLITVQYSHQVTGTALVWFGGFVIYYSLLNMNTI